MAPYRGCSLSLIIPTRNEAPNVSVLARRLSAALEGVPGGWELIFVDDSDDDTPQVIANLARASAGQIELLHRPPGGRVGGLGGAVQAGFDLAQGSVLAVMDADLQHPPEIVPSLVAPITSGKADLVAGSRYCGDGGIAGLDGAWRRAVSWGCRGLTHVAVPSSRSFQDPLSGLFALDRAVLDGVRLRPDGYKILLEVVARGRWTKAANVGYQFAERNAGASKAGLREGLVFFRLLARLTRLRHHSHNLPYATQIDWQGVKNASVYPLKATSVSVPAEPQAARIS